MIKQVKITTEEMLRNIEHEALAQCAYKNDTLIRHLIALLVTVKAHRDTQSIEGCIE